jgi:TRAP-type uncharacterized transport system fused permease subunit
VIYEPALLMIGDWPTVIGAFITASAGILLFAAGLHGYFITAANYWQRGLLVASGLLLIDPGFVTDIVGAALAALVVFSQLAARRAATLVPAENKSLESTP